MNWGIPLQRSLQVVSQTSQHSNSVPFQQQCAIYRLCHWTALCISGYSRCALIPTAHF